MAELIDFFNPSGDILRAEKDVVGTSTFYGFTQRITGVTANAIWLIARETIAGAQTELLWASDEFDQIWDDRVSLFASPPFVNDNSILFSGTNDRLVFPNHTSSGGTLDFSMLSPVTICHWARNSDAVQQAIISKQDGSTSIGWRSVLQNNQARFKTSSGSGTTDLELRSPSLNLSDGSWHFVAWSLSSALAPVAGNFSLVVDGVDQTGSVTVQSDQFTTSAANIIPVFIGVRNPTTLDFDGFMDEVAVYDIKLTPTEMISIYNLGGTGKPGDLINAGPQKANLQLWSRMGDNDTFPNITNLGVAGTELAMVMTDMKASDIVGEVP